jgi:hypothetical protein
MQIYRVQIPASKLLSKPEKENQSASPMTKTPLFDLSFF